MLRDMSPTFGPANFASENAPPSPPMSFLNDPLDDIYGSAPSSPVVPPSHALDRNHAHEHEILSDLPSRQRALDTDAYREGLSHSKGQFVQEGFDEGYSLGANFGQRVGYILGVLHGFVSALRGYDDARGKEAVELLNAAQTDLAIQELLGRQWVNEEGIWKWEVQRKGEEVTFREVADQHPVIKHWTAKVSETAHKWGVDLSTIAHATDLDNGDES
ncbi:hypothetical protein CC78DRAFT_538744 [Lojkania enalia]|uniref:Protein YAE1 n=1 Tax=Lojkania enalia TaxID=147567 RepID=A0A9P4TRW3_9PLEO|nr:hypothetical protein CC78DRAFT_538744 [Didymosphaeria enalia]